jgi:signal transduction histidine kinase
MRRPVVRAADVIVAVLFLAITLPLSLLLANAGSSWLGPPGELAIAVVVGAAMTAAVVLARDSTALALGIAWAGAVIQMTAGLPPLPVNLAVFAVLFWTGVGPDRRLRLLGVVSAVVATVVVSLYLQLPVLLAEPIQVSAIGLALVFVASLVSFALAWTLGLLFATVRTAGAERQEALAEQERGRIAREMHDVVAHSLAVIIAQADGARYASATDPELARAGLATVSTIARSALGDVRVLLAGLRHRESVGPQPTLNDLDGVIVQVRSAGLPVEFNPGTAPAGVPVGLQLAVHRIVQESLTNALRHGRRDRPATVTMQWQAEGVLIEIVSWVDAARPPSGIAGHGITGMRERARIAGGDLTIVVDERFVVRAVLPFQAAGARS